ncbi:importin-9 isoform X2 [Telopea speciosissima]|uniref:importin-9 isoform X2 n=1 Tax=Telopea speciosissima TaxID=54955 RepID=UPI001CC37745|nr:importin-9 isoform X2 [Telopea speciosissima]
MANIVDQDQQWLLNCLNATLDTNQDVRSFAETSLNQASLQPGFGAALCKVTVNKELPLGLRQLAAVILKQFIKKHWQEDEEAFEHPVVSSDEKAVIRQLLLFSLDDPHGKICTAVGMAVASIAHYDWPEEWPDLLPFLLKLIGDLTNMNGVRGGLRCLALLSGDLDDTVVPKLVPVLFPCLHTIVSSPQIYDKHLRAKALSIVHSCTSILGAMSGVYKAETSDLILPMLKSWIDQFSIILQSPVRFEDLDDWSIRMEVLKCLNQFVQNFPSLTEAEFSVIVTPLWQTFISSLKVYEASSVQGTDDPYLGGYDSDGAEKGLESFVIQLFEFLLTIVGNFKLVTVIARNVKELVYYAIAFLQMTERQVHTWSLDANQYVADEDDITYSCRVSGILLLEELIDSCGKEGIDAVIESAKKRFTESQQEKATGSTGWWRIREATIYTLASLSEQLLEAQDSGSTGFSIGNVIEQILTEDIGTGVHEYPFLHARAFSAVAKFSSVISQGILEQFLYAAIKAISLDIPPPVKVGACQALSQLLPEANKGVLQSHMMDLFSSLTDLLKQASDETLHLVLETLQSAVKAGHEAAASIEPIISPIVLNMWAENVSDPFISIDAVDVLEAIKNSPGCIHPLVSRILPSIGPILEKPRQQPDGLVAGSIDLVTMLLKNAPIDIMKAVYDVCFNSVIQIILRSDDHSEMQNATECLAAFVSGAKQDVLAWGGDPGFAMRSLLDAASRLLDPVLESSGSLFVGSYILQLILHLPSEMAPHIRDLVAAIVRRMQSCQIAGLKSSLLLIFARLVHLSAPNVEQFIDLLITLPTNGHENSLAYVMSEWTKQQGEIQGAYQIKVTTTALALLLSTRHAELAKIYVQGHLVKTTAGITTRSKSKVAPDQWTVMPLPAKILALLSDALIEIQEQVSADNDEDSDWEEIQDREEDDNQHFLYPTSTSSYSRPTAEHLDAMAKVFNEDENNEDDLLSGVDPLNEINLANYIIDFFVKFSRTDRTLFDQLCQSLTQAQHNAMQMVLNC